MKIAGFVVGIRWGPLGVALGLSVASCAAAVPGLVYCFRGSPLDLRDVSGVAWRPLLASAAGAAALFGLRAIPLETGLPVTLALAAALYAAVYLTCWLLTPRGRETLSSLLELAGDLRS